MISRLDVTPQGQLVSSPTGALALYVDLEIAQERIAALVAALVDAGDKGRDQAAEIERLKVDVDCAEGANDNLREMVAFRDDKIERLEAELVEWKAMYGRATGRLHP